MNFNALNFYFYFYSKAEKKPIGSKSISISEEISLNVSKDFEQESCQKNQIERTSSPLCEKKEKKNEGTDAENLSKTSFEQKVEDTAFLFITDQQQLSSPLKSVGNQDNSEIDLRFTQRFCIIISIFINSFSALKIFF